MDLSQLKQTLLSEDSRRAKPAWLTAETLGDARYQAVFKKTWGDRARVALDGATATVNDSRRTITLVRSDTPLPVISIAGPGENESDIAVAPASCTLTADFSLTGEGELRVKLSFLVSARQPSFKTIFPSLPDALEADDDGGPDAPEGVRPVLHGVPLTSLRLVFSTHDAAGEGLRAGLNVAATWAPAPDTLTPPQGSDLELRGQIVTPGPSGRTPRLADGALPWDETKGQPLPPGVHLRAGLKESHPLWGTRKFDRPAFRFYSPLTRNWLLRNRGYEPRMAYTGTVALGEKGEASGAGALVARTWADFAHGGTLVCSFENTKFASPGDALRLGAELLSAEAPPHGSVPDEVAAAEVTLDRAFVRLSEGEPESVGLTLGLPPAGLAMHSGQFAVALKEIGIVAFKEPSGLLRVRGTLTGTMKVRDAEFEATVELPGLDLRARKTEPPELPLGKVFDSDLLEGFPRLELPEVVIDDLTLDLYRTASSVQYDFSLRFKEGMKLSADAPALPFVQLSLSDAEWSLSGSAEEEGFPVGRLLGYLAEKVSPANNETGVPKDLALPETIKSFTVTSFDLRVRKGRPKNDYSFSCTGQLEVDGRRVRAGVSIEFAQDKNSYNGWLSVGARMFSFTVGATDATKDVPASDQMVAAYTHWGDDALSLGELARGLVADETAEALHALKIDLKDAFFAHIKIGRTPATSNYIFGVDLGAELDFSKLPVVGKYFSATNKGGGIGVNNLQLIYARAPFTAGEVARLDGMLDAMLPQNIAEKPAGGAASNHPGTPGSGAAAVALNQGLNIAADLNLGPTSRPLAFPTAADTSLPAGAGAAVPPQATTADGATWLNIQKAVGPVHFERVGVEYRGKRVWVLLSASFAAAGLTITLDGLSLGASLDEPKNIQGALRGLGIDYRNEVVEIGGSFLRMSGDGAWPEYGGAAVLKARALTVSAFGSYTTVNEAQPEPPEETVNGGRDGRPSTVQTSEESSEESSFFIYGLLDYPIGGPPLFFVTGLAAGFGYNRSLNVPSVERVGQFPLIRAARRDATADTFGAVLKSLREHVRPAAGEHFLAAGLTFTSFKLVESTVLLTAAFGRRFELHLLGLSRLRVPAAEPGAGVSPVAEVELALKGSFIPGDGFLELRAQLTPTSYLLSQDCHLTGGFAFLCWFRPGAGRQGAGPDGDFVLTLGGYHPGFHVPPHYPSVPRLGFNWQVIPETLSLRGDVYFALTPAAVMAGGHLVAEWRSGAVYAWFKAGVDFLIAWKPYHYDARAYIDIGVEVTFQLFGTQRLSLDVGADLHIWGPEFAGDATVHLWIISFTIHFGESESGKPAAIGWKEFKSSFLPNSHEVCGVAVADGLVPAGRKDGKRDQGGKDGGNDLGVINGKHFSLVIDSRVPLTAARYKTGTFAKDGTITDEEEVGIAVESPVPSFGIAPMGAGRVSSSTQTITIIRRSEPRAFVGAEFVYEPVRKNVPAALWGGSPSPTLNGSQFVKDALGGFVIRARPPEPPAETPQISSSVLVAESTTKPECRWGAAGRAFAGGAEFRPETDDTRKRDALLESLGLKPAGMRLDDKLTYDFLKPPQSEAA